MLHMKLSFNWPSGFRKDNVNMVDGRCRRPAEGECLYFSAKGSGELERNNEKSTSVMIEITSHFNSLHYKSLA